MSGEHGHDSHNPEISRTERDWINLTYELLRRAGEQGDMARLFAIKNTFEKINAELI